MRSISYAVEILSGMEYRYNGLKSANEHHPLKFYYIKFNKNYNEKNPNSEEFLPVRVI